MIKILIKFISKLTLYKNMKLYILKLELKISQCCLSAHINKEERLLDSLHGLPSMKFRWEERMEGYELFLLVEQVETANPLNLHSLLQHLTISAMAIS